MLSQYYIKTENRINYAKKYPNTGIKCSVCQLIFSIHQIENHMSFHIAPQYMVPSTKSNQIKKMSRPKLFLEEKQNDFMSSALKSIKKQELPKYQTIRNFRSIPSQFNQISTNQNKGHAFFHTQLANFDQTEAETAFQVNDVEKDNLPRQNIRQNLFLEAQDVKINQNSIPIYKTQKPQKQRSSFQSTGNSWAQSTKIQGKKWQNMKTDINQTHAYEITVSRQPSKKSFLPLFEVEPEQKFEVNLQKYKPPEVRGQLICTKSSQKKQMKKSSSFQFLTSIFGCQDSSTETKTGQITVNMNNTQTANSFWKTANQPFNTQKTDHKCQDCGGFYCATCHSTIPPQYRPANVFSKDQKTLQFYQKVVYRNDSCGNFRQHGQQKDCKDCAQ